MFPPSQELCVTYVTEKNEYYITVNKEKTKYTSWILKGNKPLKIRTANNPTVLEKDFV